MKSFIKKHIPLIVMMIAETMLMLYSIICWCFLGNNLYLIPILMVIMIDTIGISFYVEAYKKFKDEQK